MGPPRPIRKAGDGVSPPGLGSRPLSSGSMSENSDGGRTRARTWDPLIKSQLLYQLSYAPIGKSRSAGLPRWTGAM